MTGLVESIRTNHKRQGFAPHVCTECRLAWPCEALVAAQRIEATLALCDRIEDEARNFEPISADGDVAMGTRIHMMGLVRHVLTGIFDEVQP